jgi:carboxyl-terminal processing protease
MKKISLILVLITINLISSAQVKNVKEMRKVCTEILEIIQENSIVADSFDWKTYPQKIDSLILANNHQDSFRKIHHIIIDDLKLRGDNHSSYFNHNRTEKWEKEKDSIQYPNCKILESSFGYIDMPKLSTWNRIELKNYAETVRIQIKKIDEKYTIKGWIIDLRKNRGGIFEKMLIGINPLIKDGIVGYRINNKNKEPWIASIKKKKNSSSEIIEYKCKTINPKIVVLIDSLTSSAAEALCISLYTVPNVIFMGNYTGGYTTANKLFQLSNGESLSLASGFFADRTGIIHKGKLKPDIFVTNEEAIEKAKQIILETK